MDVEALLMEAVFFGGGGSETLPGICTLEIEIRRAYLSVMLVFLREKNIYCTFARVRKC